MKLTEMLPRFSGVKRTPNGFTAKCPAHNDNHQSLALAEDDGRTLLNCFAGCTADSIIEKAGLKWNDLFDNATATPSRPNPGDYYKPAGQRTKKDRRILQVYRYENEKGELLYENVRYDPKDFRQRHFDASGAPVWNLEGVRKVPYRLPQLLPCIRQGADVFLCEGEKDTDAIRECGLIASNFKNWEESFNPFIRDADVIILCDHDQPGIQHADKAAAIVAKVAKSVKIVDVFADRELPKKHGPDISDWIRCGVQDEGLTREEIAERLSVIVDNTPEWTAPTAAKKAGVFALKTGAEWMQDASQSAAPKPLYGPLWFEGEICILFADTNVGKSVLAVQIADAISRGRQENKFPSSSGGELVELPVETPAQKVVYFDFELSKKQFESRFAELEPGTEHYRNHFEFHPNFLRAELSPDISDLRGFRSFEDLVFDELEKIVIETGATVIVMDNLTYLCDDAEKAVNALPLMKKLKDLKNKLNLSILALAHTPKRDRSKPLNVNDLQGSKMLINFCDSSFAIGESVKNPGMRYVKQIKARNSERIYNEENVLLAHVKKETNFLGFHFVGTGSEREQLKPRSEKEHDVLTDRVKELSAAGKQGKEIAAELGISPASVSRYLRMS